MIEYGEILFDLFPFIWSGIIILIIGTGIFRNHLASTYDHIRSQPELLRHPKKTLEGLEEGKLKSHFRKLVHLYNAINLLYFFAFLIYLIGSYLRSNGI